VLDAQLYHQSEVVSQWRHTEGGGDSDHVFALCTLLGFRFSARIPDLEHHKLFSSDRPAIYAALGPIVAGRINTALIRAHWSEILRVAASIRIRRGQTGKIDISSVPERLEIPAE
jgi:TnpA family transposase